MSDTDSTQNEIVVSASVASCNRILDPEISTQSLFAASASVISFGRNPTQLRRSFDAASAQLRPSFVAASGQFCVPENTLLGIEWGVC